MFTGALAVSYYGRVRATVDVDVVVAVVREDWQSRLVSSLKRAGLVVDEDRIDAALKSGYGIVTFEDGKSPLQGFSPHLSKLILPRPISRRYLRNRGFFLFAEELSQSPLNISRRHDHQSVSV